MGEHKYISGTPWHVEVLTRQENDPRRHRARCVYHKDASNRCTFRFGQCIGSAHCASYKEESPTDEALTEEYVATEFRGIKEIPVDLVEIDPTKATPPKKEKVDQVIKYYEKNGSLDKPIVVSVQGDKYLLEDKYLRYYAAKQLELETISAKIGTLKESKAEDRLRKVGTLVKHQKYGNGAVIEVSSTNTTIQFENGKISKFDISLCIEKNVFSFR